MSHFAAVLGHAKQVFVQCLVEAPFVGVGMERIALGHFNAAGVFARQAGIVMIGQHQAQP